MLARLLRRLARFLMRGRLDARAAFWSNQAISILVTLLFLIGFVSIWFDDPTRLATALGLVTAGLAFALQRVVTSIAGYYIILRGRLFNLGDRISLGGVRGDVIGVGFTHTTVMEMGQPPSVQMADPAMWVEARQYTGRVVTITNDKVFDSPVYNYSREFPYLWEEMHVMIPYSADRVVRSGRPAFPGSPVPPCRGVQMAKGRWDHLMVVWPLEMHLLRFIWI